MDTFNLAEPINILILIYSLMICFAAVKARIKLKTSDKSTSFQKITVIVAFKNEESQLPVLIQSLSEQDYDAEYIDYIFVNDHSTDQSVKLLSKLLQALKSKSVILHASDQTGKKAALELAIAHAKTDLLLFTDADCQPQANWISSTVRCYQSGDTDAVIGLAPLSAANHSLAAYFSQTETFFNHAIAYLSWQFERPVMSFGRNFSYRKSVFTKLGGFESIKKSLSGDDDLLLQELRKSNCQIDFNIASKVYSVSPETMSGFIRQKTRHISAARFFSPLYQVIAGFFHLLHSVLICMLLIGFHYQLIGLKLLVDFILFWRFQRIFKFNSFLRVYILWELCYWLYILFLGSKGYFAKIRLLKWN